MEQGKSEPVQGLSKLYGFVRSRELEGTLDKGPALGCYVITAARIFAGWGHVPEMSWPDWRKGNPWPPAEPPGLDRIAKANRSLMHFRVRNLAEMRQCLAKGRPVQFVIPIHDGWYSADGGKISTPSANQPFTANHSIIGEECNDSLEVIRFWNNWGKDWGDDEYGHLPYEYFERHMQDAWVFDFRSPQLSQRPPERFACRRTVERNLLGHLSAVIDIWDLSEDIRIGWCMASVRDNWFEIEDFFIRPDQQGSQDHISRLMSQINESIDLFKCRIRLWIPHADVLPNAGNTPVVNDFIRAARLNVKQSGVAWSPFLAEQP
jgi:hypothetical protein